MLIFLCHFGGIDPDGWITSSTAFLMAFIFLEDLGLGLSLRLTCINKRKIVAGLSLVFISIVPTGFVLFSRSVAFWAPRFNLSYF